MRTCLADLESDGFLEDATRVWCGVLKDRDTGEIFRFTPDNIDQLTSFIDDEVGTLIFHNGIKFDFPLLRKIYGWEFKGTKIDTLIISRLQEPNRVLPPNCLNRRAGPHSIEAWGYRVGRGKPEHNDWSKFSDDMLHRCEEDVEILDLVYNALLNENEKEGGKWSAAIKATTRLFELLQQQEEYGWTLDIEHAKFSIYMLDKWIRKIDEAIIPRLPYKYDVLEQKEDGEYKHVTKPFKIDGNYTKHTLDYISLCNWSPDMRPIGGPYTRIRFRPLDLDKNAEIKEYLLDQGWEPAEWNYNKKGERTSPKLSQDDPFEGIEGKLGKLVAKRVVCRQRRGVIQGWLEVVRPDGRVPSVVSGLATTYRARHSIIVNVPRVTTFFGRWMRKCFIAREGWDLVGTDADGCQLRMLASRMNNKEYTEAVCFGNAEDGTDVHSITRDTIGLPNRDKGKEFNYAIIFGAGDPKAGKLVGGGAKEGKAAKQKLFDGIPDLGRVVKELESEWESNAKKAWSTRWNRQELKDGWITGLDGRKVFIDSEHKVLVGALQSDEAILMSYAYNIFHNRMSRKGYVFGVDYGTVIWMHDEFQVECKPELSELVGETAAASIERAAEYLNLKCPQEGSYSIGKSWADTH